MIGNIPDLVNGGVSDLIPSFFSFSLRFFYKGNDIELKRDYINTRAILIHAFHCYTGHERWELHEY